MKKDQTWKKWRKFRVPFSDYEDIISDLMEKLPKKYSYVYGIPRGGLVLALYLSYQMDLGLILTQLEGLKPSKVLVVRRLVVTLY